MLKVMSIGSIAGEYNRITRLFDQLAMFYIKIFRLDFLQAIPVFAASKQLLPAGCSA